MARIAAVGVSIVVVVINTIAVVTILSKSRSASETVVRSRSVTCSTGSMAGIAESSGSIKVIACAYWAIAIVGNKNCRRSATNTVSWTGGTVQTSSYTGLAVST